ncbi:hypothetical protein INN71_15015 [Nocardioides sp. ChNu-153]|uniref:DUF6912 family protein n=1 Tax=Nocardioides sp. ChNu-153 TaxID=2779364 RepID=UPI002655F0F4|nr:hypothetical protein [Nocardioides sp. ChNu-153]MDN7122699.1 hypothetical protein [Nocardioides sp. ChNu-153]
MTTRVFVPLTSSELARVVAEGRLAGPFRAHAATPALEEAWPDGSTEEWEYAAQAAAGTESLARRVEGDQPRRLVLAADVPQVRPLDDEAEPTLVEVEADVPWKRIASAHVDVVDLPPAAVAAYLSGEELPDSVDGVELDHDLAWFATQEIRTLL